MEWDEVKKDERIEIIKHYTELLSLYQYALESAEQDAKIARSDLNIANNRIRVTNATRNLIQLKLKYMGVRDSKTNGT